ncbi:MAG TPA: MBOAT family O-acyltransferase [Candidatus Omnitrophota bacterium]|nr:MBOAT family O-acyltransferase [Candidatus Omnitrophota bacterium]HPD84074.1 MBOAT family O-acyltransferase [Candidatus Omnitrophota bacterium]HRZ02931.1 MBOAT family O-acyltransferase [Candidatus Omnitrophota bacterium]
MVFNSLQFFIFFPVVTILYFLLPHKFRWFMLLAASCIFYMAFIPIYILVLAALIIIDYSAGIWIAKSQGKRKKFFLMISILSTCLVLFIFKYFNFFNANLGHAAQFLHWNYPVSALTLLLPIGLSFHTFQSLSYVIEVYRGNQKVEKNFGIYALYVMFYPQLVAGPIERPQHLLHQFYEKHSFDYQRVTDGLKLMAWGMFKKIVIADRLVAFVDPVYNNPHDYSGVSLIVATVFFAFQIYCDFSGYSDIAIGSAQVMGFKLMDNFNRPYFAKSISEFWKRWHISLSTWFRDYVYISLGGNRVSKPRWYYNLFVTFLISGLWHGANWTYIAWGALNGFYMIFSIWTYDLRKNIVHKIGLEKYPVIHKYIRVAITFSLVCVGWIFFRARNIHDALYILTHLFSGVGSFILNAVTNLSSLNQGKSILGALYIGQDKPDFFIAVSLICFMEFIHLLQRHNNIRHMLCKKPVWARWAVYYCLIYAIILLGQFGEKQFIYFQF